MGKPLKIFLGLALVVAGIVFGVRGQLVRVFHRQAGKLADKLSALRSFRPLCAGGVFAARKLPPPLRLRARPA